MSSRTLLSRLLRLVRFFAAVDGPAQRRVIQLHDMRLKDVRTITNQDRLIEIIRMHGDDDVVIAAVLRLERQPSIEAIAFEVDLRPVARLTAVSRMTSDQRKAYLARTDLNVAVATYAAREIRGAECRATLVDAKHETVRFIAAQSVTDFQKLKEIAERDDAPSVRDYARTRLTVYH